MHLVLGTQRHDLRDRTVVIARVRRPEPVAGADVLWADDLDDVDLASLPLPVGADAADAEDVHRLADAGVAVVAVAPGDRRACSVAAGRQLTVLVTAGDLAGVAGGLPAERVLVSRRTPVAGAVACWTPADEGPTAWGEATTVLAAGIRVVRTAEPRAMRRVATVVDRLVGAREVAAS